METTTDVAAPARQVLCDHCKKTRNALDCKHVTEQRYECGRLKPKQLFVCADRCASYYEIQQSINHLQRKLRAQQRRPTC
ncbi:hypothetical protein [Serratia marcescens]|uniref:hypothetical protein n=1 Tax=Serratia marcescens TaxID=615 RepID=UPI00124A2671|nr:hypothetical protein [Serratia marcescens]KAB1578731.1 hypothetical protein F7687_22615 [Serratia marcescens]